jgi:predicted DNA-binding protein
MSIDNIVKKLLKGEHSEPEFKTLTVRLSLQHYATLKLLAPELGQSVSGLLRILSEAAIADAEHSYISSLSNNPQLAQNFLYSAQDLVSEFQKESDATAEA